MVMSTTATAATTAAATLAISTPHALVLTVSHGLLFCQPLICAGTDAAVSTRRISPGP
jgi:hypothetical protein